MRLLNFLTTPMGSLESLAKAHDYPQEARLLLHPWQGEEYVAGMHSEASCKLDWPGSC